MRYLLIADIHSNPYPLYKCLEKEKGNFDAVIFLGDYISDMPYPERTMDYLYSLSGLYESYFIKGNREQYQIDFMKKAILFNRRTSSSGSLLYTYQRLRQKDLDFFQTLEDTSVIDVPDHGKIRICHGTPDSMYDMIIPDSAEALEIIENMDTEILICAHSHTQFQYEKNGKTIINPGSIGIPLQSTDPQYAVLSVEGKKVSVDLKTITYDKEIIIKDILSSGLLTEAPIYTKLILKELNTGVDYMPSVLKSAIELAVKQNLEYTKHSIPEICWEQAYNLMFPNE